MKILKHTATISFLVSALWSGNLFAQAPTPPPAFAAIDSYLCNFNDGKGMADLNAVVAKWNKWMDKSKGVAYSAWVMVPVLTSVNMPIDVAWLGVWANGNDMGKGMQAWADENGGLADEFDKVMTCSEHSSAASVNIRPPAEGWPGKSGLALFSNCTVAEGKTVQDAMAANRAWSANLDSIGSKAGVWAFFPGAGQNNPTWNYKLVYSYPDYLAYGADWEAYTNGQSWAKAQQIFGGTVSCDSQRLYQSVTVRDGGVGPVPK